MSGDEIGNTGLRSVPQVLRDGRPSGADAVALAAATAEAIAALHAAGQVHGHLDPEHVLLDEAGAVVLGGPAPRRIGPAAPPELRSADRRAVGRILALALGWTVSDRGLPVPVEDLLTRAEAAATPSTALALALRRLQRDPSLIAALVPPAPVAPAVPARAHEDRSPLVALVPRSARRTAWVAAGFVAGAALIGGTLLLVGTPGGSAPALDGTGRAVAAPRAAATAAPLQDLAAIQPGASSLDRLLRTSHTPVPQSKAPQPSRAAAPTAHSGARTVRPGTPARPTTPSAGPGGSRPTPAPAPASGTPSRTPSTAPPAATTPATPAPAPTHVAPTVHPAPSAQSSPPPKRTPSAAPPRSTAPHAG